VRLKNLSVDCTASDEAVAVDAAPGTNPVLENVTVRGKIKGVRPERIISGTQAEAAGPLKPSQQIASPVTPGYDKIPSRSPIGRPAPASEDRPLPRRDMVEDNVPRASTASRVRSLIPFAKVAFAVLGLAGIVWLVSEFLEKPQQQETQPPKEMAQEDKDLPDFAQKYPNEIKFLLRAALRGEAWAQAKLGYEYSLGRQIPNDDAEAVKWYLKAVDQGNSMAQCNLGYMYGHGRGVEKDHAEAARLYRLAAEQNDPMAQNNLGVMYRDGLGVPQDDAEAVKWYRKAVEKGNARAQCQLGLMYEMGRGVAADLAEACNWYRKAADQGDAVAQTNLGWMYENGRGVTKDRDEAIKWYRKAAAQENERAMDRLRTLGAASP